MGDIYGEIIKKAEPYLNTRKNDVHVPLAYDFARRLLKHYPEADEDVVLPAIILHDVGWKMVPEEKQLECFGLKTDINKRRIHEREGVIIAHEILASLGYANEKIREILDIVDGHDTRQEALNLNDQLVKDADKLWRFTAVGVEIDYKRFGRTLGEQLEFLARVIDEWLFTAEAKDMAREALDSANKETGSE